MRFLALLFLFALFSGAQAAPVAVDTNECGTIPESLVAASAKIVGPDWHVYRPFMCLYPVTSPTRSVVLFVLALDAEKADDANSFVLENGTPVPGGNDGGKNDPVPQPAVIDTHGDLLAAFPDSLSFPSLDPGTVQVFFSDWKDNFPMKFQLYVDDPTVNSPGWPYCPPPYVWDAAAKKYFQAKGDFFKKCPKKP